MKFWNLFANQFKCALTCSIAVFALLSIPCGASDSSTLKDTDHNCNLPSNVRDKVEHCNQVGDFDSSRKAGTHIESKPLLKDWKPAPAETKEDVSRSKTNKRKSELHDKNSNSNRVKKEEFIDVQSDAPPSQNTK